MKAAAAVDACRRGVCSRRLSVLLPANGSQSVPQHRAQLARQHRKRRVLVQLVVIVQILIPQPQAKDPLPHQRL
jgi:hypothetical protein